MNKFSSSVQSLSHVQLFATPWIAARQASLSITHSRAYSNSCPPSHWCHPAISSSVVPFCCLQSLPASRSFTVSQLFAWGGQSIGVSASASVLPVNTLDWLWIKLLLNPYEGVWTLQHPSLPLGKYQGAMAELYVKSMFIFYKKLPVFFPSSYISFCILTRNRFLLLHILVSIWWCQCFRFWPL